MKTILTSILFISSLFAQEISVLNIKGEVKFQTATSEVWNELKTGDILQPEDFVTTGKKSTVKLKTNNQIFNLGELSAVSLSSIKSVSTDELLLALAMEDMINAPKSNGKKNSSNTAAYGDKEEDGNSIQLSNDDFGLKRLNGAVQLAENGFKKSAIIFAKETYRKYPYANQIASYRLIFADLLFGEGLYEEALGDYLQISKLELNSEEKLKVEKQIKSINQILLNN
jgi:hypothetical protein